MDYITAAIAWYAVFIISITFHEAAHGFAAVKLGDPTAHRHGLVTLDPIPHIRRSPFGMVVVPIICFIFAGWMLGWASTPYDTHWSQSNRRKATLMALAGPIANLILLTIAALTIRSGIFLGFFHAPEIITFSRITTAEPGFANSAAVITSILFSLNLILLVFNMIPLPPLDGSNVLTLFLSDPAARRYNIIMSQPASRIIGLIIAWRILDVVLGPIYRLTLNILYL